MKVHRPGTAALRRIGPHHLAFLRAYLQGMELRSAADRYLEEGIDLRVARSTLRWIREDFIVAARRRQKFADARILAIDIRELPGGPAPVPPKIPTLEHFRANVDPGGDFYGEAELIELYRERYAEILNAKTPSNRRAQRIARLRARQMNAVEMVEPLLVVAPRAADLPSAWIPERLALRLERMNIHSLGETVALINKFGHRWWTRIPRLGPIGAQRIVTWLERHAPQLGVSVHQHATIPRRKLMRTIADRPAVPRCAVVPMERFAAPKALSGEEGANRGVRNRLPADNDLEAIKLWLKAKANNPNTFRAYRKEAERLLLWAVVQRGRALSSLDVADCIAYREFLADPQPSDQWIGKRQVERLTSDWRPFEGPLSLRSVRAAFGILKSMCEWLLKFRYLDSNPFDGVPLAKPSASDEVDEAAISDGVVDRHLPHGQWEAIRRYLDQLPEDEASARLRFVILLGYSTGLRASEIVAATVGRVKKVTWSLGEDRYSLTVLGKGGTVRAVPFASSVMKALRVYLAYRMLNTDVSKLDQKTRLVAPLKRYAANHPRAAPAITTSGLYRVITTTFKDVARWLADRGDSLAAGRLHDASTHWLRHTFGTHALRQGMPLQDVRGVMGHASLATASLYLHGDLERSHLAVEKLLSKTQ